MATTGRAERGRQAEAGAVLRSALRTIETERAGLEALARALSADLGAALAALPAGAVPDPMQLWWKAQLLRRWDAQRQVQLPLDLMQPIEILGGLVAAAVLLYLSLPRLF